MQQVGGTKRLWCLLLCGFMNFSRPAGAQAPTAAFDGNPRIGFSPLEVQFTDQSSGNPFSRGWSFGDGDTSFSQNPLHTYTEPGAYVVSLAVFNPFGNDTEIKPDFVRVDQEGSNTWADEWIEWVGNTGPYGCLALNADGRPAIAYCQGVLGVGSNAAKYAEFDGVDWAIEVVDDDADVGPYISLIFDSTGTAHVAYYNLGDGQLKYARRNGSTWEPETVDDDVDDVGRFTSIAVDDNDRPRISYYDADDGDLLYAAFDGVSWSNEVAAWDGDVGQYSSLVLDSNGFPRIAFYNATDTSLEVAAYDPIQGFWAFETVDNDGDVGQHCRMAISETGVSTISYYDATHGDLKVALWEPVTEQWWTTTVDSAGQVGEYIDLTLDASDAPHISYYDRGNGALKHAAFNPALRNWSIEVVADWAELGQHTGLAIDDAGVIHVTCYESDNDGVMVFRGESTTPPTSEFTGAPTNGFAPLTVQFFSLSSGVVTDRLWSFGDGGWTTNEHPSHTYSDAGTYTVEYQVENATGFDVKEKTAYVTAWDPNLNADFTVDPTTGVVSLAVQFTNATTGLAQGQLWSFGDGATSTTDTPQHTYTNPGLYTVSLTVTNQVNSDTETKTNVVHVLDHVAAVFSGAPLTGSAPLAVQFTNESTGPVTGSTWDFGDGGSSTATAPLHTYTNAGTFTVSLTVSNAFESDSDVKVSYVTVQEGLVADFTAAPTQGVVSLVVQFANASTGPFTHALWDFGDGEGSAVDHPAHTYSNAGTYTVSLTVSNEYGTATRARTDYISVLDHVVPAFSAGSTLGETPFTVSFTNDTAGPAENWAWDFGDGGKSSAAHATHTYSNAGVYTVRLQAANAYETNVLTRTNLVCVLDPLTAYFSATPLRGPRPLTVQFTDESTGSVTHRLWDFGDGHTSTNTSPSHDYSAVGQFTVSLTVSNAIASDVRTATDLILTYAPTYVAPEGSHTWPYHSWSTAAHDIQSAISAQTFGGTVWVSNGTYRTGSTLVYGALHNRVALTNAVRVIGFNGPAATVIEGQPRDWESTPQAVRGAYVGSGSLLSGFTVRAGGVLQSGDDVHERSGGGVLCEPDGIISNCIITGNSAEQYGGGVYGGRIHDSEIHGNGGSEVKWGGAAAQAMLIDCLVYSNSGYWGGAVYGGTNLRCTLRDNVGVFGGATCESRSIECLITDNESFEGGGNWKGDLENCLVAHNLSKESGGAYGKGGGCYQSDLVNCTVADNEAQIDGGGIYGGSSGNSIIYVNTAGSSGPNYSGGTFQYSCTTPPAAGTSNIVENPAFVNRASRDYHLATNSPCIDSASDMGLTNDLDQLPRPQDGNDDGAADVDMGAFEFSSAAQQLVDARFRADARQLRTGQSVGFSDESTGPIVSWSWDFGDGVASSDRTPSHAYAAEGVYTVALTVDGAVHSDTETKSNYIAVRDGITVDFTGTPQGTDQTSLTVQFTNLTTGEVDGWLWDFGDFTSSTERDPSHHYDTNASYTVTLTAGNSEESVSLVREGYINVGTPITAGFLTDRTNGIAPLIVQFWDTSSGPFQYGEYDFGDGTTASTLNPTHTYTNPGIYTVRHTASNDYWSDTVTKTNLIEVLGPVAAGFSADPTNGFAPLNVQFTDESTGPVSHWLWAFGDGQTSTSVDPLHTYDTPGDYTVTLTAGNAFESSVLTKTNAITVHLDPVVAAFSGEPLVGPAPLNVQFTNRSSGPYAASSWDFGDGEHSVQENPLHMYDGVGSYSVSLTVSNAYDSSSTSRTDYVVVEEKLGAWFTVAPPTGAVPLTVQFTDQSTGMVTQWSWDFGDGSTDTTQNPSHTYTNAGLFTTSLVVSNATDSDTVTRSNAVTAIAQVAAAFDATPRNGPVPLEVAFTNESTGPITGQLWSFGDGTTSTDEHPAHSYTNPGSYTVSLTVSNAFDTDSFAAVDFVTARIALRADFSAEQPAGDPPHAVTFTDESVGLVEGRLWMFGDGTTSAEVSPAHTYTNTGAYTVSLTVTNVDETDTRVRTDYITVEVLAPDFTAGPRSGVFPLAVQFTNTTSGGAVGQQWNFGDGTGSSNVHPSHTYLRRGTFDVTLTASNTLFSRTEQKAGYIGTYENPAAGWQIERVETSGDDGSGCSLAIDSAGNPHISYRDSEAGVLKYAHFNGVDWHVATIGAGSVDAVLTSIALTTNDRPAISTYCLDDHALKYAWFDGVIWRVETVDDSNDTGVYSSLAFGADGHPRISYYDQNESALRFARHDGASWQTETVDDNGAAGLHTSLAVDTDGHPCISYMADDSLRYAAFDGSGWQIDSVPGASNVGFTSLALDSRSQPVIAFYDSAGGGLKLASRVDGAWRIDPVDTIADLGDRCSLVLDAIDAPRIAYFDRTNRRFKYAARVRGSWQIEILDAGPGIGMQASLDLGLDAAGRPGASYYDDGRGVLSFAYSTAPPSVDAAITTTPRGGPAPLEVEFSSRTAGPVTHRSWDFGDGQAATGPTSFHTYSNEGPYTVTLTVSNSVSGDAYAVVEHMIVGDLVVDFSATPTTGLCPLTVAFTNLTSGYADAWQWDFGDGGLSTERDPHHTYLGAGLYTVSLSARNLFQSNSLTRTHFISPLNIAADFSATDRFGPAPLTVAFRNDSSGPYTAQTWDFGDGTVSTEINPVHTYYGEGHFDVSLTVTAPGQADTETKTAHVRAGTVAAAFTGGPVVGPCPLIVTFTNLSSGPVTWQQWDFGQGTIATNAHPTFTYSQEGLYTVSLWSGNGFESNLATREEFVLVLGTRRSSSDPLAADFAMAPGGGSAPVGIQFVDTSWGAVASWSWDFGDGQSSAEQHPRHNYASNGTHDVVLTVGDGVTAISSTNTVTVLDLEAAFSAHQTSGGLPLTVHFADDSRGFAIESWMWDFGDGSTSVIRHPTHTFTNAGIFPVSLTVTNWQESDTLTVTDYVEVRSNGWVTTVVDSRGDSGWYTSLALSNRTPHIAYYDAAGSKARYATYDGGTWTLEDVGDTSGLEGCTDLELRPDGLPAMTYYGSDGIGSLYYYGVRSNGVWQVESTHEGGMGPSGLAFYHDGRAYLAYAGSLYRLQLMSRPGDGGWSTPQWVDVDASARQVRMGIQGESLGISYYDATIGRYAYTFYAAAEWQKETVDPAATAGAGGTHGLAFRGGIPQLSYYDATDGALKYADRSGFAWSNETVDNAGDVGLHSSIAFDSRGVPRIAYYDVDNSALKYAVRDDNRWGVVTLDNSGSVGTWCSLALDPLGNPAISYYDEDLGALKYLSPQPVVVDFSATPHVGTAPLMVTFTNRSQGPVVSWLWQFGDGATGSDEHPSHVYTNNGVYTVTLTANDGVQAYSRSRRDTVTVADLLAGFSGTPTNGLVPLSVAFMNNSAGTYALSQWDFGDGHTSSDRAPTHTYTNNGTFTASLTISGEQGSDTLTRTNYVAADIEADFVAGPTAGLAPLTVWFSDRSTGPGLSYQWEFGDGQMAGQPSPVHVYTTSGVYTVSLTISNAWGTAVATQTNVVEVLGLDPSFTADVLGGAPPVNVQFTDQSTGTVTSWLWNFGDGAESLEQHPLHSYTNEGVYTVTLTAGSAAGARTLVRPDYIEIGLVRADFEASPRGGVKPLAVHFTDRSTGFDLLRDWSFGDGTASDSLHPVHVYTNNGIYTVTLAVTNTDGTAATTQTNLISVENCAEPNWIIETADAGGIVGRMPSIALDGGNKRHISYFDSSNGNLKYARWNGTVWLTETVDAAANVGMHSSLALDAADRPLIAYLNGDARTVKLARYDGLSWQLETIASVANTNEPVSLAIDGGDTPHVAFHGTNGLICAIWDGADWTQELVDNFGPLSEPSLQIDSEGKEHIAYGGPLGLRYAVRSGSGWAVGAVGVTPQPGAYKSLALDHNGQPWISYKGANGLACAGYYQGAWHIHTPDAVADVAFRTGLGIDRNGNPRIAYYVRRRSSEWTYDLMYAAFDGSAWRVDLVDGPDDVGEGAQLTLDAAGNPHVAYFDETHGDLKHAYSVNLPLGPQSDFSVHSRAGSTNTLFRFSSLSLGPVGGWLWTFGDGMWSAQENPIHQYPSNGLYTVSLTVTNATDSDRLTRVDYVTVGELDAGFSMVPTNGPAPLVVAFTSASSGTVDSWFWQFGDGQTSTLENPEHDYDSNGLYTVSLTISNGGAADTVTRTNGVFVHPLAEFSADPTLGALPFDVQFTNTSQGIFTSQQWRFGDGESSTERDPLHRYHEAGIYAVTLTATDGAWSNSLTRTNYITAGRVQAAFSGEPRYGLIGVSVNFTNESTGPFTHQFWRFGDGETSTNRHPVHVYTNANLFDVTLTVSNAADVNSVTGVAYIAVDELQADFGSDLHGGTVPVTIHFTNRSTGPVTSLLWDFGDGQTSTEPNPAHTYTSNWVYNVTLTVLHALGENTRTRTNYITTTWFIETIRSDANVGYFPSLALDADDHPHIGYLGRSAESAWYAVHDGGDWRHSRLKAEMLVSEARGGLALSPDGHPVVSFCESPHNYYTQMHLRRFDGTTWQYERVPDPDRFEGWLSSPAFMPDGTLIVAYQELDGIDLKFAKYDGASWQIQTIHGAHKTIAWGPDLAVAPNGNVAIVYCGQDSLQRAFLVGADTQPEYIYLPRGCHPAAAFDSQSRLHYVYWQGRELTYRGPAGPAVVDLSSPTMNTWGSGLDLALTSDDRPCITYTDTGNNHLKYAELTPDGWRYALVRKDDLLNGPASLGLTSGDHPRMAYFDWRKQELKYVSREGVSARFTAGKRRGTSPLTVHFTNTSYGAINSWSWEFEGGGVSSDKNPVHTFTNMASYDVTLTVSGPLGTDETTRTDYIEVKGVISDFVAAPVLGPAPLAVQFTSKSEGEPTDYEWLFGDFGGISTEENPQHVYYDPGIYSVTLTVSNAGDSDVMVTTNCITVTNLAVVSHWPLTNDWGVCASSNITVVFNMPATNVTTATFLVENADSGGYVLGSVEALDARTHVFVPHDPLPPGTGIEVTVVGGAGGVEVASQGAKMVGDYVFSYTTFPALDVKVIQVLEDHQDWLLKDKPTLVRVFAEPFNTNASPIPVKVDLFVDGVWAASANATLQNAYSEKDEKLGLDSANVFLPADCSAFHSVGDHAVTALVMREGKPGHCGSNTTACAVSATTKPFVVEFVPLADGAWRPMTAAARRKYAETVNAHAAFLKAVYPVTGDTLVTRLGPDHTESSTRVTAFYRLAKAAEASAADRIVGVYPVGWISDAGVQESKYGHDRSVLVVGNPGKYATTAHELMHTFGRYKGAAEDYTVNKPHGLLAEWGWWVEQGMSLTACRINVDPNPDKIKDEITDDDGNPFTGFHFFTYMGDARVEDWWTMKEDYEFLFNAIVEGESPYTPSAARGPGLEVFDTSALVMISGVVSNGGTLRLDPIVTGDALDPEGLQPDPPAWRAEFYGDGSLLRTYRFDTMLFAPEDEIVEAFVFTVLMPGEADAVHILDTNGVLRAAMSASANPPLVNLVYPNGGEALDGEVEVTWSASDADGDDLSYALYYRTAAGEPWRLLGLDLTGTSLVWDTAMAASGEDCRLMIVASDGFHTTEDLTDSTFAIAENGPLVSIISPLDGAQFDGNATIDFYGTAIDLQGSAIDPGDLVWMSDRDGVLGSGPSVSRNDLSYGLHEIALRASTASGVTGISEVVRIEVRPFVLASGRTMDGQAFYLDWFARFDAQYSLESTTNLVSGPWVPRTNLVDELDAPVKRLMGFDQGTTVIDPATSTNHVLFYRIKASAP